MIANLYFRPATIRYRYNHVPCRTYHCSYTPRGERGACAVPAACCQRMHRLAATFTCMTQRVLLVLSCRRITQSQIGGFTDTRKSGGYERHWSHTVGESVGLKMLTLWCLMQSSPKFVLPEKHTQLGICGTYILTIPCCATLRIRVES